MTLWFVTPAYRRYSLSAVCFEQRRRVIDELAKHGIDAQCVIVADDENLDLARSQGFATVEQRNDTGLGRKFNDGMEYAGRNGAEWIVPIGSDSWIDPKYFIPLPISSVARTSRNYAVVKDERIAYLNVATISGAGPYVFHRSLLERCGFRPAEDDLPCNIDHSTLKGIVGSTGQNVPWRHRVLHPAQYVGFRGTPHITSYERLVRKWGVSENPRPWRQLAQFYGDDLVAKVRAALAEDARVAA